MSDEYAYQISGKSGDVILLVRGNSPQEVVSRLAPWGITEAQVRAGFQDAFGVALNRAAVRLGLKAEEVTDVSADTFSPYTPPEDPWPAADPSPYAASPPAQQAAPAVPQPNYNAVPDQREEKCRHYAEYGPMVYREWPSKNGDGTMKKAYMCPTPRDFPKNQKCKPVWVND